MLFHIFWILLLVPTFIFSMEQTNSLTKNIIIGEINNLGETLTEASKEGIPSDNPLIRQMTNNLGTLQKALLSKKLQEENRQDLRTPTAQSNIPLDPLTKQKVMELHKSCDHIQEELNRIMIQDCTHEILSIIKSNDAKRCQLGVPDKSLENTMRWHLELLNGVVDNIKNKNFNQDTITQVYSLRESVKKTEQLLVNYNKPSTKLADC